MRKLIFVDFFQKSIKMQRDPDLRAVCVCSHMIYINIYIYIYIYQGFLKSGIRGAGLPATWPKWLRETTKVAARIIEWLRKS